VLESNPQGAPESSLEAWDSWDRKGVAQFHQPHLLFARARHILDEELPGLTDALTSAGGVWANALDPMTRMISDREPRPDDDRFMAVTGRRPMIERVMAAAAEDQPGVTVRRGVRAAGLIPGHSAIPGTPGVGGVRTETGEELRADLVVDAMGRRTPTAEWLTELGAHSPYTESEDSGFTYYSRFFTGPSHPALRGPQVTEMGTFSLLTLDGDNHTRSVTLYVSSADASLKALRDPELFTQVVRACPMYAHWPDGRPSPRCSRWPDHGSLPPIGWGDTSGQPAPIRGTASRTALTALSSRTPPRSGRGLGIGLQQAWARRGMS